MLLLMVLLLLSALYIWRERDKERFYRDPKEVITTEDVFVKCSDCTKLDRHDCIVCDGRGKILVDRTVTRSWKS